MTEAELLLWRHLRQRQVAGHKFRRQVPIGPYIADFACLKSLIVVEVDGGQHADARAYDSVRDDFMRGQGFRVLRFWNNDVLNNIEGVFNTITTAIKHMSSCGGTPHPNLPPPVGEGRHSSAGGKGLS